MQFKGWWEEQEKRDNPDPWETFTICLHGTEAGETAYDAETINGILAASGYRIRLEKVEMELGNDHANH